MKVLEKVPQSVEAEQSVLGAMMLDFGAFEAAQPLKAEHFFRNEHQLIYRVIAKINSENKTPDPVLIYEGLGDAGEDCGGLKYIDALLQSVPSGRNVDRYAKIIRTKAIERGMLEASNLVPSILAQNIGWEQKLDAVLKAFEGLAQSNVRKMPRSILEIALERSQYYVDVEAGDIIPGWPTHIPMLDKALTGGLKEGKLMILAARPGVGKSSLSWQIARTIASQGKPSLFLSMEMPDTEVADRAVTNMAKIDYHSLLTGGLSQDGWKYAVKALEEMKELPLYVDDQPALTITDIKTKARSIKGLKLLVVDYLQLCQGEGDNRNTQIEEISRGLKNLAKELNICVIALSQLNRSVEKRVNPRPMLSDLRDSGAIEQDADVVMFLWQAREFGDGRKLIGLGIDKNRQGKQCDVPLDFEGRYQRWCESMDNLWSAQNEPKPSKKGFDR